MKHTRNTIMTILILLGILTACAPAVQPAANTVESPTQVVMTEAPQAMPSPTVEIPNPTAASTETVAGITITDALNRQVNLPSAPMRIVITGKALFMLADAAYTFPEALQRVIGLGNAGQGSGNFIKLIDPNYGQKEVLAGDAGAEQVAALKPDLVILKSYLAETVGKPIEQLQIPVVYVDFETPESYVRDLAIFGEVFQDPERAKSIQDYYQNKINEIANVVEKAQKKPRVLLLYYTDKDGKVAFNVPPLEWMQTKMVQLAGGEPAWADANPAKGWTQVTLEQIAAWDADQVYIISYNKNPTDIVKQLKDDAAWKELRAVKENQLYAFAGDLYSWDQPDVRWILGLTWLAGRMHPDLFPNLDIVAEAKTFYKTLYGLDQAYFDQNIRPTFKGDLP